MAQVFTRYLLRLTDASLIPFQSSGRVFIFVSPMRRGFSEITDLQPCVGDFARLLVAYLTIDEVMSYKFPLM